jgi:hypothetical protein
MLEIDWHERRICKLVSENRSVIVRTASGCGNPLWIFEGIAKTLCLINNPFPIKAGSEVREYERELNAHSIFINSITNL